MFPLFIHGNTCYYYAASSYFSSLDFPSCHQQTEKQYNFPIFLFNNFLFRKTLFPLFLFERVFIDSSTDLFEFSRWVFKSKVAKFSVHSKTEVQMKAITCFFSVFFIFEKYAIVRTLSVRLSCYYFSGG
jgi:hypothetical protein